MPTGPGTYGSQIGRPKKRQSGRKARKALAVQADSDSDLEEGKEKQARIKLDKYKTKRGATASNQADDPRRSPSLSSGHNSPEGQARRRAALSPAARADLTDRMYYRAKPSRASKKTFKKQIKAESIVNTYGRLAELVAEGLLNWQR
mgnify:CR=1 FL=1